MLLAQGHITSKLGFESRQCDPKAHAFYLYKILIIFLPITEVPVKKNQFLPSA